MRILFLLLLLPACLINAQPSLIDPTGIKKEPNKSSIDNYFTIQTVNTENKKSVPLAVFYSLLLPGMGELYAGDYSTGKYLTAAEGALWLTLIGFDRYGTWLKDDARTFAVEHAGISLENKNDRYFVDIGNYNSINDYNEQMLRDRNILKLYSPSQSWFWDKRESREYYRDLRIKSDNMFNSINFVAAAIALNHIVSAINAARLTISHNSKIDQASSIYIRTYLLGGIRHPHGIMISFSKSF